MEISGIHINQYINGELQGETLIVFEAKLKADKGFRDKVNMHKEINTLLMKNYLDLDEEARAKEKERLQPIFDEMKEKHFKENNDGKAIIRKLWPIIALAVAASFLLFVFNPFANNYSPAEIADKNFKAYPNSSLMSPPDINSTKIDPKQLLAEASQYYQNNQTEKAIQTLQKVVEHSSEVYKQDANWYLALCYLRQNESPKAKPLLEELKQNSDYKKDAKAILKQLK